MGIALEPKEYPVTYIWMVLVLFAFVIGANMILSFYQEKNLATTYIEMRRKYPLAIGKHKRLLASGSIVMFGITPDGRICEGRAINGYSVFSRFKPLNDFDGWNVAHLNKADLRRFPVNVRRAITNASDNYMVFIAGGVPEDPRSPLGRIADRLPDLRPRKTQPKEA